MIDALKLALQRTTGNCLTTLERWRKDFNLKLGQLRATGNRLILGAGIAAVALVIIIGAVLLLRSPGEFQSAKAPDAIVGEDVMQPGDLPEIAVGKSDAKVTIVEYASMTCPACANFHTRVMPQLKTKYIDTGKVRLIFREFPLDNLAVAASMLARCVSGEGPEALIDDLFKRQNEWAVRGDAVPKLFEVAKQAGFTQASFDKCLTDQELYDKIVAVRERASKKFGVNSTPTFFINGKRLDGIGTMVEFEKALEPLLKSS